MLTHDETGRNAEARMEAAKPFSDHLVELRERRDAAIAVMDAIDPNSEAWLDAAQRATALARRCIVAHRDYREALAYGRPLTRRERREIIRKGG